MGAESLESLSSGLSQEPGYFLPILISYGYQGMQTSHLLIVSALMDQRPVGREVQY